MEVEDELIIEAETGEIDSDWNPQTPLLASPILPQPVIVDPSVSRRPLELVSEPMFDRYAQLDAARPRVMHTFEDGRLPGGWEPLIRSDVPAVPEPPALLEPIVIEERFEHPVDLPDEIRPTMIVAPIVELTSNDHSADLAPVSLESQLHDSIVEAARDVRSAVEQPALFEALLPPDDCENHSSPDEQFDPQVERYFDPADRRNKYDVVQPVDPHDQSTTIETAGGRRVDEPEKALRSRGEATPRGGMFFSTLRRRFKNQRKPV